MSARAKNMKPAIMENGSSHAEKPRVSTAGRIIPQNYQLDREKAIKKKLEACHRPGIEIVQQNGGNYTLIFNTATFELVRIAICNDVLVLPVGRKKDQHVTSRSISYTPTQDKNGVVVSECIQIRNWNAVRENFRGACEGQCALTINLFKTSTKCLLNGTHAHIFMDAFKPYLDSLLSKYSDDIVAKNQSYKEALQEHISSTAGSAKITGAKQQRPFPKNNGSRKINPHQKKKGQTMDQADSDDEEVAGRCLHCNRRALTRAVLCETCHTWRHYRCEKLTPQQIDAAETPGGLPYECKSCQMMNAESPEDIAITSGIDGHPVHLQLQSYEEQNKNVGKHLELPTRQQTSQNN